MTDPQARHSRGLIIALLIVAVVIVAGTIIIIVSATRGGQISASAHPTSSAQPETSAPADTSAPANPEEGTMPPSPSPFTGAMLPEPMGGQEAIDALGDKIEIVAKRNGKTVEELEDLLLRDKTAQVSTTGFIVYIDTFKNEG